MLSLLDQDVHMLSVSRLFLGVISIVVLWYSYYFLTQTKKDMASLQPLKFLTVPARATHTATVIFVHVRDVISSVSFSLNSLMRI